MVTDVNKFACVPNKDAIFLPDANLDQIASFHLDKHVFSCFMAEKKNHRVSSSFCLQMKSNNYFAKKTSIEISH